MRKTITFFDPARGRMVTKDVPDQIDPFYDHAEPDTLEKRLDAILSRIRAEVLRAGRKHPPMNSAHEGYAVILEEVDELWDHVKADTGYSPEAMTEASQIAAMGVRYMLDLGDDA